MLVQYKRGLSKTIARFLLNANINHITHRKPSTRTNVTLGCFSISAAAYTQKKKEKTNGTGQKRKNNKCGLKKN
jgi:hypothetical protein